MGHPILGARTRSFVSLGVSNRSIVLVSRSYSASSLRSLLPPNYLPRGEIALGVFHLLRAIYLGPPEAIHQFIPPKPFDLWIAGFLGVIWMEPFKKLLAERTRKPVPEGTQGPGMAAWRRGEE